MTAPAIDICLDRDLPDDALVAAADRAVEERPSNAPADRSSSPGGWRDRVRLALLTRKMWRTGQTLNVAFLDGEQKMHERVLAVAGEWSRHANLRFALVEDPDQAHLRVGLSPGGSWSAIGIDALFVPNERATMNLGSITGDASDVRSRRGILHEFGHALGCVHEHSSPAAAIPWDREAVYRQYAGPPNLWSTAEVDRNVFERYAASTTQHSAFDADSIMLYPIAPELTGGRYEVGWNTRLSAQDRVFIGQCYPFPRDDAELLVAGDPPVERRLRPGQVDHYRLVVSRPGTYAVETARYLATRLRVLRPDGSLLADVSEGGPGQNARAELALMEGEYRVEVRHQRTSGAGRYGIVVHDLAQSASR